MNDTEAATEATSIPGLTGTVSVTLSTGETVTARPPTVRHLAALEAVRKPFADVVQALFAGVVSEDEKNGPLAADAMPSANTIVIANLDGVAAMIALHTGMDAEAVKDHDLADLVRLVGAVRGCNLRFFTDRLLPDLVETGWLSLTGKSAPLSFPGQSQPTTTETEAATETAAS